MFDGGARGDRLWMSCLWMNRHRLLEMLNMRCSLSSKLLIEK